MNKEIFKMKSMKKLIAGTIGIMAIGATLTGCSSSGEGTSEGKTKELKIMMSFPQYMNQWEEFAKDFEDKKKEEGVNVKINLEMPASDQYDSVLQTRLSGGDAPDLYTLHANNLETYNKAGHLTDLSDQPLADNIVEDIKETVTYEDELLAVPLESSAWGVLYNKEIFENNDIEIPETFDELVAVTKQLNQKEIIPFELAFQEQWVPQLMTALTIGGKVSGENPGWVQDMNDGKGSYEQISDIWEPINLIMSNGTKRAMEQGAESGAADFANGGAAMFIQGTWSAQTMMETNPDLKLGVFPLPITNNKKSTLVNLSTSTTLAVYPDSEEEELALEFANYVIDGDKSSDLFEKCGFNPVAKTHNYEVSSWVEDAYKYVNDGRSYQDLVLPQAVTEEQGKLLQELYVDSVTTDEIMKKLDDVYAQSVD